MLPSWCSGLLRSSARSTLAQRVVKDDNLDTTPSLARRFLFVVLALLPTTTLATTVDAPVPVPEPSGAVTGRVVLTIGSQLPARRDINGDHEVCGLSVPDERVLVGHDRGLARVVVYLDNLVVPTREVQPAATAVLELRDCLLQPRISTMIIGQTLELRNRDSLSYTIEGSLDGEETLFRLPLAIQNQSVRLRMKRTGVLALRSVAGRDWIEAFIVVSPHAWLTTTTADGSFELRDVPVGEQTLVAWHETLGTKRIRLDVAPGEPQRADFAFSGP